MTSRITDNMERLLPFAHAILDITSLIVVVLSHDGSISEFNRTAERVTGYTFEEVRGRRVWDLFIIPEEVEPVKGVFQQLQAGMFPNAYENFWLAKDGTRRLIAWNNTALLDDEGQVCYVIGTGVDITERRRAEDELRTFKALAENSLDGIMLMSLENICWYANPAIAAMSGLGARIIGRTMLDLCSPEACAAVEQDVLPAMRSEGAWQGRLALCRPNGSRWIAQISGFTLFNEAGAQVAVAWVLRDITDQLRAEAEHAALQQQIIATQELALRELSTPLIPIAEHVVIMPLIGAVDSQRARQVMETLLEGVATHQAEMALIDITGVQMVDTQVANALISASQAVKLLGAQVILTGIQPQIAQTLVHLGTDLGGIITLSTLQAGIAYALARRTRSRV